MSLVILDKRGNGIVTSDVFIRTDKDKVSSLDTVYKIIESFGRTKSTGDTMRRSVLLWCNALGRMLCAEATGSSNEKRIILDIGTGTEQSVDSFPDDDSLSYVFIEADEDRSKSLVRRLGCKETLTKPEQLKSVVKSLKSRSIRYCVMRCPLGTIVEDEYTCKLLIRKLEYPVAPK